MLHIHNGDSTAGTAKEFGMPGEHFAFREVLVEGPAPDGVSDDEWIELRARFLSGDYSRASDAVRDDLVKQQTVLRQFASHDEAVLWFEHDLFCQVNLVFLLDFFSRQPRGATRLSLICIGEFPGVPGFRGLGELRGDQLASLLDSRHEITQEEFNLATQAWSAYRSADPSAILSLLQKDCSALPFLEDAMRLHLVRFPSVRNGLGRIENQSLELLDTGGASFGSFFPKLAASEGRYGFGDLQVWSLLTRLANARQPAIRIVASNGKAAGADSECDVKATIEITEAGKSLLNGKSDFIEQNGIDLWLGGVHLRSGSTIWRWDESRATLVRT